MTDPVDGRGAHERLYRPRDSVIVRFWDVRRGEEWMVIEEGDGGVCSRIALDGVDAAVGSLYEIKGQLSGEPHLRCKLLCEFKHLRLLADVVVDEEL